MMDHLSLFVFFLYLHVNIVMVIGFWYPYTRILETIILNIETIFVYFDIDTKLIYVNQILQYTLFLLTLLRDLWWIKSYRKTTIVKSFVKKKVHFLHLNNNVSIIHMRLFIKTVSNEKWLLNDRHTQCFIYDQ